MTEDVVRKQYRELTEKEKFAINSMKDIGQQVCEALDEFGSNRELSIAKTKIEEAVMWAVKGFTK